MPDTESFLFLGGENHGTLNHVPKGRIVWNLPIFHDIPVCFRVSEAPRFSDICEDHYIKHALRYNMSAGCEYINLKQWYFFVHESVKHNRNIFVIDELVKIAKAVASGSSRE